MFSNDLLAPYLLKELMDCDQTCKDIAIAMNNYWERVYN